MRMRLQPETEDKPRAGSVASGLAVTTSGDVGFIVWLDSQPRHLSDVPVLIDSECKKIQTLSACAGVHKNLVSLSAP